MNDKKDSGTRKNALTRRALLKMGSGAALGFTFLQRRSEAQTIAASRFIDKIAVERLADRGPADLPILIDMQTHVWWRANGIRQMSQRGEAFLKSLAGARATVIGRPVPIADMGRVMFFE